MSNNQWNNPPADGPSQPPDGSTPAPQPSAGEWAREGASDPNQQWGQGQSQSSASDWGTGAHSQQSASDWTAAPQQQSWDSNQQQGWGHGQQQGWDPHQQQSGWGHGQQQGWDPNQQQGWSAGQGSASSQPWQPQAPARTPSAFSNVFDFSFKKFALPEAGGTIFLIAVIGIVLRWLMDVVSVMTLGYGSFATGLGGIGSVIIGGLATSFIYILLVRAFLEGMSALVRRSAKDKDSEDA